MSAVAPLNVRSEADQFKALYELLAALIRARGLDDVYEAALGSLLGSTAADRAAILLFDDDGVLRFKASRGLSSGYQQAVTGHSPWKQGTRDAHAIVVPDVLLDAGLAGFKEVLASEGIRAAAFIPLELDNGVLGKFMLYYREPHECSTSELEMATAIAAHVTLASEQKRAELASARSEQRLQAVIDNSAAVIFVKDLQGRYVLVNRRYEELFHVTKTTVIGRTDHDIFPAEIANKFQANDLAALTAAKPLMLEEYAPHDDGIHSYISIKFPLAGPDGVVTGVCGIATDITDRKQLEAASSFLAAVVDSSDDAIITKDLNGTITSWNGAAERIFGYTAAEVIGKPVSILTAPDRSDEFPDILSRIRQGERVESYETKRRRKDGQIIDVALTVSPIREVGGRIVGASKISRDITGRKRAEQERALLLAREQEARRTAELLNLVAPRLAAQLDVQKLVQEVADIATALIGAEVGSFVHNVHAGADAPEAPSVLSGVPQGTPTDFPVPRNTDLIRATFRGEAVRCDDAPQDPRHGETPIHYQTPDGQVSVRSYLSAPVVARSGEVLGGLFFGHSQPGKFTASHDAIIAGIAAQAATAMDNARLFEQSQWAQSELKRSNEELRRANADLEVFAYSASHDLQEPLRTISVSAELIERNLAGRIADQDAAFLRRIRTASQRMNLLIKDLLAYTKATKYEEGPAPSVDPARVLANVLENLRGAIEEAGAVVTAAELPVVAIHERRLAQVLQNLIGNAIKYRSREVPRVDIAAEERDGWCVFSVADNGIGIEPQFADQIFGLFKRLHGRDEYPGSGIGLAICQRVVEQYGGRVWLESSVPGAGSTFRFSIPSRSR